MKSIYLHLLLFSAVNCLGQQWQWVSHFGAEWTEVGYTVNSDVVGNIYITGETKHITNGNGDNFLYNIIWKISPSGSLVWSDTIPMGNCASVTDDNGNTYVIAGPNIYKFNSSGNKEWVSADSINGFTSICLHPQGGFVVSGVTKAYKGIISRYDSQGVRQWKSQNSRYGTGGVPKALACDNAGNILFSGGYKSDTSTVNKACLVKLSSTGQIIKILMVPGSSDMLIDSNSNFYLLNVGGGFEMNGNVIPLNITTNKTYLIKYNSNGDYLWHKEFTGTNVPKITGIEIDKVGNLVLAGEYVKDLISDDINFYVPNVISNSFILKLNPSNGHRLADFNTISTNAGGVWFNELCIDFENNIIITGGVLAKAVMGNFTINSSNSNASDMVVAKVISMNNFVGLSEAQNQNTDFTVYPNPSSEYVTVNYNRILKSEQVEIKILNVLGSEVYSSMEANYTGSFSKSINLHHLSKGIYFVNFCTSRGKETAKIVVH